MHSINDFDIKGDGITTWLNEREATRLYAAVDAHNIAQGAANALFSASLCAEKHNNNRSLVDKILGRNKQSAMWLLHADAILEDIQREQERFERAKVVLDEGIPHFLPHSL